jgi:hypothetical protein
MNKMKLFILLAVLGIAVGCKSKKTIVTSKGEVEMLSPKSALKAFAKKNQPPTWVKINALVDLDQNGSSNSADAEIRMCQDSIMWVELSHPIFKIKGARAFAMADTVAFYNRIDQTYFAGSYQFVEKKLGTSLPFSYIFQVFQGQLFMGEGDVQVINDHYVLTNKTANGEAFLAEIEPFNLDCVRQVFTTSTDVMTVTYADYREMNGFRYPYKINVTVAGRQNVTATFAVKTIETDGPYKMPFQIGNNYKRLD